MGGKTATRNTPRTAKDKTTKRSEARTRSKGKKAAARGAAARGSKRSKERSATTKVSGKITVQHVAADVPEGLPKKFLSKSTFNTHDIMHSPVEKTLKMIDKILAGERLFTM